MSELSSVQVPAISKHIHPDRSREDRGMVSEFSPYEFNSLFIFNSALYLWAPYCQSYGQIIHIRFAEVFQLLFILRSYLFCGAIQHKRFGNISCLSSFHSKASAKNTKKDIYRTFFTPGIRRSSRVSKKDNKHVSVPRKMNFPTLPIHTLSNANCKPRSMIRWKT